MALKTTVTTNLREIQAALSVTYTRRRIYGSWTHITLVASSASTTYNSAWEYVRNATKTYRYVGLTYDTAVALAAILRTYYTRTTKTSDWNATSGDFETIDAGDILMSDVVTQHDEGGAYSVNVSVREEDRRTSLDDDENVAILFSTENARTYDEGAVPS